MINYKSILVTGGTGSFGKAFVKHLLSKKNNIKRLVIYSRDEWKQSEMAKEYPVNKYPMIRFFIGDIRDLKRLDSAFEGIDLVIHAAALKQVPAAEYNPIEFIKTNIIGAQNIIEAAMSQNVKKVIALSTDKATAPLNLYGATKLCSDKLFISANNLVGSKKISFSVCRYGNVMGTRGSVVPFFFQEMKKGILPVTHKDMTRFNILLKESIELVLYAATKSIGREIFVPKIPSYKILDLAKAFSSNCKIKIVGIRPGEKIHEEMISEDDSLNTFENKKYYIIYPSIENKKNKFIENHFQAKKVKKKFSYKSNTNNKFLSSIELKKLMRKYMNYDL